MQRKRHAAPFSAVSSHGKYDIMSTKEKQATLKAAFVFLVPLENEQPAEAGDRARQRGLVIEGE